MKYVNIFMETEARFLPNATQNKPPDSRLPPNTDLTIGSTIASFAFFAASGADVRT
jgi:hypothetical protein